MKTTPVPPLRVFHDWEFLDDGRTILPLSVGMVTSEGRELYRVFRQTEANWTRIEAHPWLMANVVPYLPIVARGAGGYRVHGVNLNHEDADAVDERSLIADAVREFLVREADGRPVELWGYFSAYDHVALAQLFGPMVNKPAVMPMWTNDLQQVLSRCPNEGAQFKTIAGAARTGPAHHALGDARWNRDVHQALVTYGWLPA